MTLPSLFANEPSVAPPPAAKGKKKAPSSPKASGIGILDYLVDVAQYRNPPLKIRIDVSDLTQDALSQRPGMEWLGQCQMYLVSPTSRDIPSQRDMLAKMKAHFLNKAQRITQSLCPSQFPEGFNEPILAIDLETTGLDTRTLYTLKEDGLLHLDRKVDIVGVCLAISQFEGYYLPVRHTEEDGILNFDPEVIERFLDELNQEFFTVLHNTQYDREVMAQHQIKLRPAPYFSDTQILHFLWDVNQKQHGLKFLSKQLLGRMMVEISELFGGKSEHISFDLLPASAAYVYGCSDATNTFGLFYFFCSQPDSPYTVQPIPTIVDMKTADTCRSMYRTGAPANYPYYYKTGLDCIRYLNHIQVAINELAGYEVELGSPKQLSTLLFDEFKLPPLPNMERGKSRTTKEGEIQGSYSTAEEVLDELFEKYPDFTILKYIVLNRKLINYVAKSSAKVMSNSFVDDFQPFARVQFSFSQTVIPTGRLSSNSSDGKERVSVKENKTKLSYSYEKGDGTCGFNSQGVTSSSFRKSKARRIKAIPPESGIDPINVYTQEEIHRLIKATAKL